MDKLLLSDWIAIISALAMILSVIVTASTLIAKNQSKIAEDAELKSNVKHIKEMVENTSKQLQVLGEKIDGVDIRLTRAEESCKSAHKRIDSAVKRNDRNLTC